MVVGRKGVPVGNRSRQGHRQNQLPIKERHSNTEQQIKE